MDYQFSHDILGNPVATCELECEAFGDWLSHEIAQDFRQITLLLNTVHQLQANQLTSYQHNGKEYHLEFDKDEVELIFNNNHIQEMTSLAESNALAWQRFRNVNTNARNEQKVARTKCSKSVAIHIQNAINPMLLCNIKI